jgi:hypothetical protein
MALCVSAQPLQLVWWHAICLQDAYQKNQEDGSECDAWFKPGSDEGEAVPMEVRMHRANCALRFRLQLCLAVQATIVPCGSGYFDRICSLTMSDTDRVDMVIMQQRLRHLLGNCLQAS